MRRTRVHRDRPNLRIMLMPMLTTALAVGVHARAEVYDSLHFDCGEDTADRMTLIDLPLGDGGTVVESVGGRSARRNLDPVTHKHIYFGIDDTAAVNGNHPQIDITITYYDLGTGTLVLQYDSSDDAPFPNNYYKTAGSITLNDTQQWLTHTFNITDAYLANRQNGGADLRIVHPQETYFYIDLVTVDLHEPPPPPIVVPASMLGATHASGKYFFDPSRDFLNEGAVELATTGMRAIKVWAIPDNPGGYYMWNSNWPSSFPTVTDLADYPYYRELWRRPFETYVLTITGGRTFRDGFPDPYPAQLQQEFYDLAVFFLTEYDGTGKTFILGTWESDWQLRGTFDLSPEFDPDATAIAGMIRWYSARQAGVTQARLDYPSSDVNVYAAAEVNHMGLAMQGRPTVANDVLPYVNMDLITYSTWGETIPMGDDEEAGRQGFLDALNYLAGMAPDSTALDPSGQPFGDKNIVITEFGAPEREWGASGPAKLERITRGTVEVAYTFGCPWMFFWELYCNECCDPNDPDCVTYGGPNPGADPATNLEHCRGFWLKRVDGTDSAALTYFENMLDPYIVPPDDFDATPTAGTSIELTWTDVAPVGGSYLIERSVNGMPYESVATPPAGTASELDTAVWYTDTYRYRLRVESTGVDPTVWFYSQIVPATVIGDTDRDGDVDSDDIDTFIPCATGPAIPTSPGCEAMDFDGDADADQTDFGLLQRCFSGADNLADLDCANPAD